MRNAIPSILALLLAGCITTPRHGEAARLMAFPGFQDASKASPGWVVEALDSVAELEYQLSRKP